MALADVVDLVVTDDGSLDGRSGRVPLCIPPNTNSRSAALRDTLIELVMFKDGMRSFNPKASADGKLYVRAPGH